MPIYTYRCPVSGKEFESFSVAVSLEGKICGCCGKIAPQTASFTSFVPPEGDLTYVSNRNRMRKGIYHDQDAKQLRRAKEKNKEMQEGNARSMGALGMTEKIDTYDRKHDSDA